MRKKEIGTHELAACRCNETGRTGYTIRQDSNGEWHDSGCKLAEWGE